jgi:hypothetical protein
LRNTRLWNNDHEHDDAEDAKFAIDDVRREGGNIERGREKDIQNNKKETK